MVKRSATARLFVAVDPPLEVREQLSRWARSALRAAGSRVGAGAPIRVLDPELMHVTLCFLGNRPVGEIEAIGERLATIAPRTGEVSVGAPLWLPARRPRALAVELHDDTGELEWLQRHLLAAMREVSDVDGDQAGRRRFRPHVTVARMAGAAAGRRSTGSPIGRLERTLAATPPLSFTPRELVLYRSWLSPAGPSYEAIRRRPL